MPPRLALLGPVAAIEAEAWSPPAADEAARSALRVALEVDWDAQMRDHNRRVVVSLLGRGVPIERAKELAQDAWIRVIQNHRAGKLPRLQLPGVVIAQADFLARDERRRAQRRGACNRSSADDLDPDSRPNTGDLEDQVVAREQLRRIATVVGRAPVNARHVFSMMFGGNAKPAAQIAEELGLSVQRVRQIACELRKRIREELGGHDDG